MKYPETIPIFDLSPDQDSIFYNWIFKHFSLYIKPRVLVLGDHTESLIEQLIQHKIAIHLAVQDASLLDTMSKKLRPLSEVKTVNHLDVFERNFTDKYARMLGMFGTIISLETTDYSAELKLYLKNVTLLLRPGGHFLSAPASFTTFLFDSISSEEEWGTWERKSLRHILRDYQLLKFRHFISDTYRPRVVYIGKQIG